MNPHLNSCIQYHASSLSGVSGDYAKVIWKKNYRGIQALCHWKVSESEGLGREMLSSCAVGARFLLPHAVGLKEACFHAEEVPGTCLRAEIGKWERRGQN